MWRASNCPEGKARYAGKEFNNFIAENLNTPIGRIYKAGKGKGEAQ
jgi:hypothetical protein